MKKIIREFKEEGYITIQCVDERWYIKPDGKGNNIFYPSCTWICDTGYAKGIPYMKWLASLGWDESKAIKEEAGTKGQKVHYAITDLLDGKEVLMSAKYYNETKDLEEELTLEEYDCLLSFIKWFDDTKPRVLAKEMAVFNEEHFYAGTMDLLCKINDKLYLIDFKTGQNIWPSWELQVSAYKHALSQFKDINLAILQLGYFRNKNKYKFTEVEDKFDLFLSAKKIWQEENSKIEPKKIDYPLSLKLNEYIPESGKIQ